MSDLGNLLKKAREQRGYSLDDIQEMTKIRKRYLEAIEEGEYKVLPGNFYVRAFVKNYAETVGLDAEEVLRLYHRDMPATVSETVPEQPMMNKRRASAHASDRWSKWGFRLLMWSFLALIAVVVYVYAINNQDGTNQDVTDDGSLITDQTELPEGEPDDQTVSGDGADVTDPANAAADGKGTPPATVDEEPPPQVELTFVEAVNSTTDKFTISTQGVHKYEFTIPEGKDSWIEVRSNNRNGDIHHYQVENGPQVITKELEGTVFLNIGATANVEIRIDGVLLEDGNKTRKRFIIEPAAASVDSAVQ